MEASPIAPAPFGSTSAARTDAPIALGAPPPCKLTPTNPAAESPPQLLDLPCELLAIIASGVTVPRILANTCRTFRAICLALSERDMHLSYKEGQALLSWQIMAVQTLSDIEALNVPHAFCVLFLRFIYPILKRAHDAAKTPEEFAAVDRAALRFVAHNKRLALRTVDILTPDTIARLALWYGDSSLVCMWLTEHLLGAEKMRELSAGLALALWYACSTRFVPHSLEDEMQALAKRVDAEAGELLEIIEENGGCNGDEFTAGSTELKWAQVGIMINKHGWSKLLESRVYQRMRAIGLHKEPRPTRANSIPIDAESVFTSEFFVRRNYSAVPAFSISAEDSKGLDANQIDTMPLPFDRFNGEFHAPLWLLYRLSVYLG